MKPATATYLRCCIETTGEMVLICMKFDADELAVTFAQQGLRAARMLGLYVDDGK